MIKTALMNVMTAAVRKAARGLVRDFGEVENLQVSRKGVSDFVTNADMRAERTLRRELEKARPDYGFLLEEGGEVKGKDPQHRWIVDPLDGTTNFLHSIPLFAISVGLERDGEIVAGIVYNPVSDELFAAERGKGAYLNERRLRVAARRKLDDCVVTLGIPHLGRGDHAEWLDTQRKLMERVQGVRRTGSAALDLAWVAAGRFDGFVEKGLSAWDIAGGMALVREAGGYVTDWRNRDTSLKSGDVVAANPEVHNELIKSLRL
ncbi:inositol monophosphatase family protein [Tepidamorphus sp. 3E244]|uniref:inositol monophosphatase family protein n=1 Tax=Tepidamorphus sp. 3E244 TaxID=3385498 RepID=UPI0038FC9A09